MKIIKSIAVLGIGLITFSAVLFVNCHTYGQHRSYDSNPYDPNKTTGFYLHWPPLSKPEFEDVGPFDFSRLGEKPWSMDTTPAYRFYPAPEVLIEEEETSASLSSDDSSVPRAPSRKEGDDFAIEKESDELSSISVDQSIQKFAVVHSGDLRNGVLWDRDYYVSADGASGLLLRRLRNSNLFSKDDISLWLYSPTWDPDAQIYTGLGAIYLRAYRHCPIRTVTATYEMEVQFSYPFRGAFASVAVKHDAWKENEKCDRVPGSIRTQTTSYSRIFTSLDYKAALDRVRNKWSMIERDIYSVVTRLKSYKKFLTDDSVEQLAIRIEAVEKTVSETNDLLRQASILLSSGGSYNGRNIKKSVADEPPDGTVSELIRTLSYTVLDQAPYLKKKLEDLADQIDQQIKESAKDKK